MLEFQLNPDSRKGPLKIEYNMEDMQHCLLQFQMVLNDSLLNITSYKYVYQGNKRPF